MGAVDFTQVAVGADAREAFAKAKRDAQHEHGHGGYSGTLAEKHSFVLVALPPRQTLAKLLALLSEAEDFSYEGDLVEDVRNWRPGGFYNRSGKVRGWKGNLAKAERALAKHRAAKAKFDAKVAAAGYRDFDGIAETYSDKWGSALCVELSGAEAKRVKERYGVSRRRGIHAYCFFGIASS
jgi:hypothetical protein